MPVHRALQGKGAGIVRKYSVAVDVLLNTIRVSLAIGGALMDQIAVRGSMGPVCCYVMNTGGMWSCTIVVATAVDCGVQVRSVAIAH